MLEAATQSGQASLALQLASLVDSETWQDLGLSSRRRAAWESYARRQAALPDSELALVGEFLDQYNLLVDVRDEQTIPARGQVVLDVREHTDLAGTERVAVYAHAGNSAEDGQHQRLYLLAYDGSHQPVGLILAPEIPGLQQRISSDGLFVEYLEPDGAVLFMADARQVDINTDFGYRMDFILQLENVDPIYINSNTYPRFRLNLPGIHSGFFGIEKLTLNQVRLLISTFELFELPHMQELKEGVFLPPDEVAYVITRDARPTAAAAAMVVTEQPLEAIVLLYSRVLFDNRYTTAAAISHEAAHIWQGEIVDCDYPEKLLASEIGNRRIPAGFLDWTGAHLIKAIRAGEIGAYHVSLWVLEKFNQREWASWSRQVILTGSNNGHSLLTCE